MTPAELDEIEARAKAATEGQWGTEPCRCWRCSDIWLRGVGHFVQGSGFKVADAAFIAAAREDVPELVAEVRALKRSLSEYGACDGCGELYPEPHTAACPRST